jgi:DNA-binding IscR family transcriptional regulator
MEALIWSQLDSAIAKTLENASLNDLVLESKNTIKVKT